MTGAARDRSHVTDYNRRILAGSPRGLVAEADEPPMMRAMAIIAGDDAHHGAQPASPTSWHAGAVVPWPAGQ